MSATLGKHSTTSARAVTGCASRRGAKRTRGVWVTDRDRELLAFVAAHRFVLALQARAWLGWPAESTCYRRLAALTQAGFLSYARIFDQEPGCYRVRRNGLAVAGSGLPVAKIDLRSYAHDADLVWLWLAARGGEFGVADRVLSEREMRHHDQRDAPRIERYGIPLVGVNRHGRARSHYPDVLVVGPDRRRVGLELELSLKSRRRLRQIIAAYGAQPGLRGVVYFTSEETIAEAISETAATLGVQELVRIRYLAAGRRGRRRGASLLATAGRWDGGWR